MADIDGGGLSFVSELDNDQLKAAIEETLRRIQGLSDGFVEAGDSLDSTMARMADSFDAQRGVVDSLEATVASLNQQIADLQPGDAQDKLIEQAEDAERALREEKVALVALGSGLNMLQRVQTMTGETSDQVRAKMAEVDKECKSQEAAIDDLKTKIAALNKELADNQRANAKTRAQHQSQINALEGEMRVRQDLLRDLRANSKELMNCAKELEKQEQAAQRAANTTMSLRQRMRELQMQMVEMEAAGQRNTDEYRAIRDEVASLCDAMGDARAQMNVLANDEAGFAGVMQGLSGLSGGFSAVAGAMGLFGNENQDIQNIILKTQSIMAITNGLMQVSQTLNKDSAFMLGTVGKLREWYNGILLAGAGAQATDTAATEADTTAQAANAAATEANTAATTQNTTAQTANAAARGAVTGATEAQTTATAASTAAQAGQTAAARAGTVANIGLAGGFRMIGAAIKSIPVFGWILAGISALIGLYSHFSAKASEAKKKQQEFNEALVEGCYKPIGAIEELSGKWSELGDDFEAKKQFVEDNKKKFEELGVSIHGVTDAENLLISQKDAFIDAQVAKAKAMILIQQGMEAQKEALKLQMERDQESQNRVKLTWSGFVNVWKQKNEEMKKKEAESRNLFAQAREAEAEGFKKLEDAGIQGAQTYAKGTLGAIEKSIQEKQAALKLLTDNEEYKRSLKELADLQDQANKITGNTTNQFRVSAGGSGSKSGGTAKDPFIENLEKRKAEYSRFMKWMNSGDAVLIKSAKQEFESLLKEGATYIEYLKRQREQILAIDVTNRTNAQNKQLRTLNDAIAEETKRTVLESFNEELSEQMTNAKSVIEMLKIIEQKRKELAKDGTEIDNEKSDALDKVEKDLQKQMSDQIKGLLEGYGGFVAAKRKLEEDFNADMAILERARINATTEAERKAIETAIANRKQKFAKDNESSGDSDYDELKKAYRGYEDEISAIQKEYAEKRRVARLHGDTAMLARLAAAEEKAISEVQRKMLEDGPDWSALFDNLDSLSTKTIREMIAKFEAKKIQFGGELSPEDLKTITEKLEEARRIVEERNPFGALGSAFKRLRQQMKDQRLLNDDDPFIQDLHAVELQYKEYEKWLKSGGKPLPEGVNTGLDDLLKQGTTYLQYLYNQKRKLEGDVKMGVDVGNSLEQVDAMIRKVESGKSANDMMKDVLKDTFSSAAGSLSFISGAFDSVVGGMEKMGIQMDEETQQILGDIGGIMEGAAQVAEGIASGNPLAMIQGTITALTSVFDLFNTRDRAAQKSIRKHQEEIDKLQESYKQLEWQIDKALGGATYRAQQSAIKNLQAQRAHLAGMAADEQSKKKSDSDKVKEYQSQIADLDRQIQDMMDNIANDILQTDAKSFADTLSSSLVDAFASGEDAAKAFEKCVNDVLKNAIVNQLKKRFLEQQLQSALDNLESSMGYWSGDNFVFDGLSDAEIANFKAKVQAAANNFNQALGIYEDLLKDLNLNDDSDTSLTGAVKGVSEETASLVAGQMNAVRMNQYDMINIMRQQLMAMNQIVANTSYNRYLTKLDRIINLMERGNSVDGDLRSQGLVA